MEIRIGVEGNIVYASPKCEERGYSFVPSYLIFIWIMYMYVLFYICLDCVHVFIIFLSLSRLCTVSLYYIFLDCVHVFIILYLSGLCTCMCCFTLVRIVYMFSLSYICLDWVNQLSYSFSFLRLDAWIRAVLHTVQHFFSNCCFNLQRKKSVSTPPLYVTVWYLPIHVCGFFFMSIKTRRNISIAFRCFKTFSISNFFPTEL